MVQGLRGRVEGLGFRVWGLGFRVRGLGFRIKVVSHENGRDWLQRRLVRV